MIAVMSNSVEPEKKREKEKDDFSTHVLPELIESKCCNHQYVVTVAKQNY